MHVEVFLTGTAATEEDVRGRTVIVIDVLRTSTTIAAALSNGARDVVPVADMAEAGKLASAMDQQSYLLGGERGGVQIEGYHLGNSPLDYTEDVVGGKTVILNTTNGTGAIHAARGAAHLVVGSFLNARRAADYALESGLDVTIICAGWRNRVSLEDTLCAGLILSHLWGGTEPDHVSDGAHIAFSLYDHDRGHLEDALRRCNHAQRLGDEKDMDYCFQIDTLPVLPYYQDNRLVLLEAVEESAT